MALRCVADFCILPLGVEASVTKYVAECQRVVKRSGLSYQMHSYGTGIEGDWDEVTATIRKCHEAVHAMGCPRISTTIKIGTRTDKESTMAAKVSSVQEMLARDGKTEL